MSAVPIVTLSVIRMDHVADGRRMVPCGTKSIDLIRHLILDDPAVVFRGQWAEQAPPHENDHKYSAIVESEILPGGIETDDGDPDEIEICEHYQIPEWSEADA